MDYSKLFAERIGGSSFGRSGRSYKFSMIKSARDEFIKTNPGLKVIDMGIGEPEERAPDSVIESLYAQALRKENRIYSNNGGPAFKQAAARYLRRLLNADFNPETEIVHCIGTKSALAWLPMAFVNPGETVVATVPGYPVLPGTTGWLGGEVVSLPLLESNCFLPDLSDLTAQCRKKTPKLVLLNYPNNPTGAIAPLEFYRELVSLAQQHGFIIVQDAAYADFVYQGKFVSPFQVPGGREVSIESYSLSKSFNMQGFRLGFVASNPALLSAFAHVKDNTDSGQFLAVQESGAEALDRSAAFTAESVKKYQRRLNRVASLLTKIGLDARPPAGTFYLYVKSPSNFHGFDFENAEALSKYLVSRLGIITVPWDDAGAYLRLSMTFEIGTPQFRCEEDVYSCLEQRLTSAKAV
jgi:LL-diaminopimelate aminotransferase